MLDDKSSNIVLYVVVPCFNEQEVLPITAERYTNIIRALSKEGLCDGRLSRLLLVDDGSEDRTWPLIRSYSDKFHEVEGVRLSRNRGHQNALLCGLMEARASGCSCAISIDADGQDDAEAMRQMLCEYISGSDVVYGVRTDRENDSWAKRLTAEGFYHLMSFLGVESVFNHADYRLLSNRVLDALADLPEVNLYLRGLVPLLGFPAAVVGYSRSKRLAGESHYPISKMLALAIDGITSMSVRPIRFITGVGGTMVAGGLGFALLSRIAKRSNLVPVAVTLTGIQLFATGIVGEYVGKAYMETKRRPRYIVMERTIKVAGSTN